MARQCSTLRPLSRHHLAYQNLVVALYGYAPSARTHYPHISNRHSANAGVPTFYRWLHDHYPKCITEYHESTATVDDDEWTPNPNGMEVDNFVRRAVLRALGRADHWHARVSHISHCALLCAVH